MDRSVDRRQRMQMALDAAGIAATRVPAVDGKLLDPLGHVDCISLPPPADRDCAYPKFTVSAKRC